MKRKSFAIILCCLLMLTLFAGCKKTPTNQPPQGQNGTHDNNNNNGNVGQDGTTNPDDNTAVPPQLGTTDEEVTVDHLLDLIGKTETDLTTAMGEDVITSDESGNRTYKKTMFGNDAEVQFSKGTSGNIETVVVTVDKDKNSKWSEDLVTRYGENKNGVWTKDDVHVKMEEHGDRVTYTFTKTVAG